MKANQAGLVVGLRIQKQVNKPDEKDYNQKIASQGGLLYVYFGFKQSYGHL